MNWGISFADSLAAAKDAAGAALRELGSAADTAAAKAAELAGRAKAAAMDAAAAAKQAAVDAAMAARDVALEKARAARDLAAAAGNTAWDAGKTAARKVGAVGVLAGDAAVVGTGAAVGVGAVGAGKAYGHVKDTYGKVKERFFPTQAVARPCLPCLADDSAEARKARIEKRNQLIEDAQSSPDRAARAAAKQLRQDMKAVELARLSENTYAQYDPTATAAQKKPPEPWTAMTAEQAQAAGLNPRAIRNARAVVYTAPSDFPFEPKTVVAFRGTTAEAEDILTDHDQALGLKTRQYEAARELGEQLGNTMPGAEVTGHSLGGGKAQAAGVAGGLKGQMFNSAGLHPNSVGLPADGLADYGGDFVQYRSAGGLAQGGGDPLTGLQNSMKAQEAAFGLFKGLQTAGRANQWALKELGLGNPLEAVPEQFRQLSKDLADRVLNVTPQEAARNFEFSDGQWYVPPAVGEVRGVPSKTRDGADSGIAAQHSITNLVYGLEERKARDIQTLLDDTGHPGPASDYVGKMVVK